MIAKNKQGGVDMNVGFGVDIPSISMAMSKSQVQSDVGVAMLSNSLDVAKTSGDAMVKMMEQSVNPYLGSQFDMLV